VVVFVGGAAARAYTEVLQETDSVIVEDLGDFHRKLTELGGAPPAA
jgi:hypothetical protein